MSIHASQPSGLCASVISRRFQRPLFQWQATTNSWLPFLFCEAWWLVFSPIIKKDNAVQFIKEGNTF